MLTIEHERIGLRRLPKSFESFRVVQLSDIHHGPFSDPRQIERAVDTANRLQPDIIALTGDYISKERHYAAPCAEMLGRLRARFGVYAVRVSGIKSPKSLPGVANYGLRPTVEQATEPRLEVHVLGACPFGEGDAIQVDWLRFIRAEKKFADVGELRTQIAQDRGAAEAILR